MLALEGTVDWVAGVRVREADLSFTPCECITHSELKFHPQNAQF